MVLVEDGKSRCVLVLPDNPLEYETLAAEELQLLILKMSGARLPMVTAGRGGVPEGSVSILIGSAAVASVPNLELDRALGERRDAMSCRDGFVLRADRNVIAIAGVRHTGTLYGAYELLERLGYRWFWPGELGEVLPRRRTVTIEPFETVQVPSFDLRSMWICGFAGGGQNADSQQELAAWFRRNRGSLDYDWPTIGHEPFPVDLGNPAHAQWVAEGVMSRFAEEPSSQWQGLSLKHPPVTDEMTLGLRRGLTRQPHLSDALVGFLNRVIEQVEQKFPDRLYGITLQWPHLTAPLSVRPHRSLAPMIGGYGLCTRHPPGTGRCWQRDALLQTIENWKSTVGVKIYDFEPSFIIDGGIPLPAVTRYADELPRWQRAGMRGLFCQAQMSVMNNGPNLYVRARLSWDVHADVDALMSDYFSKLFGPSARPARAWWDALERLTHEGPGHQNDAEIMKVVYPIDRVQALEKHIIDAEAAANSEPLRRRVRSLRFSHENLMLYLRMRRAEERAEFGLAADLALESCSLREEIEAFDPYFYKVGDLDMGVEDFPRRSGGWARHNRGRHELTDGTTGDRVAPLPDQWSFRTDPHDLGNLYRWYDSDTDMSDWKTIRTSLAWELQGYEDVSGRGYDGVGWYRTRVDVPGLFAGRSIKLNFGGVAGKMNVWVNGRHVAYRPFRSESWPDPPDDFSDLDVTDAVVAGRTNTITIRVDNESGWGGIIRRVLLWSPNTG